MEDDRDRWGLPPLAVELEDAADAGCDPIEWATARLRAGVTSRELVEAAAWVALRRTPVEGRTILGLVPHGVLAAPAIDRIGTRTSTGGADRAAVGHVAYVAAHLSDRDLHHGPLCLRWFEPGVDDGQEPVAAFRSAASIGDVDYADHAWLALAAQDPAVE